MDNQDKVDPIMAKILEKEQICKQCPAYQGMDIPCNLEVRNPCVWWEGWV